MSFLISLIWLIMGVIIGVIVGLILGVYINYILKRFFKFLRPKVFLRDLHIEDIVYKMEFVVDQVEQSFYVKFISKEKDSKTIKYFHPRIQFYFSDVIVNQEYKGKKDKYAINFKKFTNADVHRIVEKTLENENIFTLGWSDQEDEIDKLLKNSII